VNPSSPMQRAPYSSGPAVFDSPLGRKSTREGESVARGWLRPRLQASYSLVDHAVDDQYNGARAYAASTGVWTSWSSRLKSMNFLTAAAGCLSSDAMRARAARICGRWIPDSWRRNNPKAVATARETFLGFALRSSMSETDGMFCPGFRTVPSIWSTPLQRCAMCRQTTSGPSRPIWPASLVGLS